MSVEPFKGLSASERILLAQYLWDSVAAEGAEIPLDDATRKELDRILAAEVAGQMTYENWDSIKKQLL